MAKIRGYVGTYRSGEHPGTYRFQLDTQTGALTDGTCLFSAENTKYAACWPGGVATLTEQDGMAGLCLLNPERPDAPLLDTLLAEQVTACSLSYHEGKLYTANYHDGTVLVYVPDGGKLRLERRVEVGSEAGCHQIIPHGRWMLIPCLELDKVCIFDTERDWAKVGEIPFAAGVGPRHGVFNTAHTRFFLNSERSNELFSFAVRDTEFTLTDTQPILPADFTGKGDTAALRLSADGKFLYTTVRGGNLIAVFAVTETGTRLMERIHSGGVSPWDLVLAPGGAFALVSNRKSGEVASFSVKADGRLGEIQGRISVPEAVGIALE